MMELRRRLSTVERRLTGVESFLEVGAAVVHSSHLRFAPNRPDCIAWSECATAGGMGAGKGGGMGAGKGSSTGVGKGSSTGSSSSLSSRPTQAQQDAMLDAAERAGVRAFCIVEVDTSPEPGGPSSARTAPY